MDYSFRMQVLVDISFKQARSVISRWAAWQKDFFSCLL